MTSTASFLRSNRGGAKTTARAGVVPVAPSAGRLQPLGLDETQIVGGFWGEMTARNREHTIPHILHWLDKAGWIGNFDAAVAGALPDARRGREFSDSEVYKALEAVAWQLAVSPEPTLAVAYDDLVERVAAAQEPDGYLNTNFGRPGQAPRYSDLEWGHELYCYGHLFQAAVARLRTGHDDLLVDVARSAADRVSSFGPSGLQLARADIRRSNWAWPELGRTQPGSGDTPARPACSSIVVADTPWRTSNGVEATSKTTCHSGRPTRCEGMPSAPSTWPRVRSMSPWRMPMTNCSRQPSGSGVTQWPDAPISPVEWDRGIRTRGSARTSHCPPTGRTPRPAPLWPR